MENRETRLSRPFLGPGDNFSKSYDENHLPYNNAGSAGDLRSAGDPSPARACFVRAGALRSGFRHNFSGNYLQDLKMV